MLHDETEMLAGLYAQLRLQGRNDVLYARPGVVLERLRLPVL